MFSDLKKACLAVADAAVLVQAHGWHFNTNIQRYSDDRCGGLIENHNPAAIGKQERADFNTCKTWTAGIPFTSYHIAWDRHMGPSFEHLKKYGDCMMLLWQSSGCQGEPDAETLHISNDDNLGT